VVKIRYNNFRISSCKDISPGISGKHQKQVRSRFSMNIIHCPKFLRASPLSIRTCSAGLAKGSASGEGGDVGAFGKALADVSAFMVTMNCSFNASCN